MTKVKIEVIKAKELDPTKRYLIELDSKAYTQETAQNLLDALTKMEVPVILCINDEGKQIEVKELPSK